MKLSIIQLLLGIIIVFLTCYIPGLMIAVNSPLRGIGWYKDDAAVLLFHISKYSSYFLPFLGILTLVISTLATANARFRNQRLAIVKISTSTLIAVLVFVIANWAYPYTFTNFIFHPEAWRFTIQTISAGLLLASLAEIGLGIIELVQLRKKMIY